MAELHEKVLSTHPPLWFCSVFPEVKFLSNKGHSRTLVQESLTFLLRRRKNNWQQAICYYDLKSHYRLLHHQGTMREPNHDIFLCVPAKENLSLTTFHHRTTCPSDTHTADTQQLLITLLQLDVPDPWNVEQVPPEDQSPWTLALPY